MIEAKEKGLFEKRKEPGDILLNTINCVNAIIQKNKKDKKTHLVNCHRQQIKLSLCIF